MRNVFFLLCFELLIGGQAQSGSLDPLIISRVRDLTLEGLESAYNFDVKAANERFDAAIAMEPSHPRPHVAKLSIHLWRYLLAKKDTDYDSLISSAEKSIDVCERYIDRYGEDADALICLGTVYGYRAFAYGRTKSYLKSAWDGKKSFDCFNDALKLDPHAYDAYLGMGVFHYFTAFMPKALQWIVSILGVSGDSELALKELRIAAEKGTYCRTEAKYYLAQFLPWQEDDFVTSEAILKDLSKQYPSNRLVTFTIAAWEIRRNDVRAAKDRLEQIALTDDGAIAGVGEFARYKLAECHFRLGEYARARELYQLFLGEHHEETYLATANYRIGICYELAGKRDEAIPFYRAASGSESKFGDDMYASRHAARRIKFPLNEEQIFVINGENALRSGNYPAAKNYFRQAISHADAPSGSLSEASYGLGETLFEEGAYADALSQFQLAAQEEVRTEAWIPPWAEYQSGLCLAKLGRGADARKHFERALEFDDYDFKNWLSYRTERELAKLQNPH